MILSLFQQYAPLSFGNQEMTDRMWHEQIAIAGLILFPLALIVGQLSLRIASHSPFRDTIVRADIYNVMIRLVLSDLIMEWMQQSLSCIPFEQEDDWMELVLQSGGVGCPLYAHTLDAPAALQLFGLRILAVSIGLFFGEGWMPVAITGGIATGKSTVAKLLVLDEEDNNEGDNNDNDNNGNDNNDNGTRRHIPVIDGGTVILVDTDKIGHDILLQGTAGNVYSKLVQTFGADAILSETEKGEDDLDPPIDRTKLGATIFSDQTARTKLNAITHPRIIRKLLQKLVWSIYCTGTDLTVADVPLLFEAGIATSRLLFCLTICVTCTPTQQLERLQRRNPNLTEAECQARIAAQMPLDQKAKRADLVLDNSGNDGPGSIALEEQVEALREQLMMRLYGVGLTLFQIVTIMGVSLPVALYFKLYQDAQQQNGGDLE